MNTETKRIKYYSDLTDAEIASGKWKKLEDGIAELVGAENPFANVPTETAMKETTFRKKLRTSKREPVG